MSPAVTVIVVTYRSEADLPACLAAIAAQRDVRVDLVVVDNDSPDRSAAVARACAPAATVIVNPVNVGYGRANNQVMRERDAPWYAIVNPDAVLPPDALALAIRALAADASAGIASLRHVDDSGATQPSAFAFLGLARLFGEMFALDRILPALSTRKPAGFDSARVGHVDWLQGSFLVVRGEAVRATGGFDEDFFMYGEDMEWAWRLRRAGWRALYLPEPVVQHIGGASGRDRQSALYVAHLRGRIRFFERHRGALATFLARAILATSILARMFATELAVAASLAVPPGRRDLYRAAWSWVRAGAPTGPEGPSTAS